MDVLVSTYFYHDILCALLFFAMMFCVWIIRMSCLFFTMMCVLFSFLLCLI